MTSAEKVIPNSAGISLEKQAAVAELMSIQKNQFDDARKAGQCVRFVC